jgi:hypothetical protein
VLGRASIGWRLDWKKDVDKEDVPKWEFRFKYGTNFLPQSAHPVAPLMPTLHFRTLKMELTYAEEPAGYGKFLNASNGRKYVEVTWSDLF